MRSIFFFALGVAAGMLLAPDSGDKNLQRIRSKLSEVGGDIEDRIKEQLNGEDEEDER